MADIVTIDRPDVVALIATMADRFTAGDRTEAVALALRRLGDTPVRTGSLFGVLRGTVRVAEGVDLTEPLPYEPTEAETGAEIDR